MHSTQLCEDTNNENTCSWTKPVPQFPCFLSSEMQTASERLVAGVATVAAPHPY